jgi:hypothetical protein
MPDPGRERESILMCVDALNPSSFSPSQPNTTTTIFSVVFCPFPAIILYKKKCNMDGWDE